MSERTDILPSGTMLHGGQYCIDRHLASGGFGNTYLAMDVNLNVKVVIKEFYIKTINYRESDSCTVGVSIASNLDMFHSLRNKFKKEAQRIFKIQHKNVVRVFSLFEEFGTVYYAMDFIKGESLNGRIKRDGPVGEPLARSVFMQMLDALEVVHQSGFYHLDIKPHNIMLTHDGVVKLIDFGASKHANQAEATTITGFAFTPEYAAPELTNQEYDEIGPWTDIYSLGITLYRILSDAPLPSKKDIRVKGASAFVYSKPVSGAMRQLIVSMTQGASERRPQSIAQLRALANQLGLCEDVPPQATSEETVADPTHKPESKPQPKPAPQPQPKPAAKPKSKSSKKFIYIGAAVALVLIALVSYFSISGGETEKDIEIVKVEGSKEFKVNGVKFTMVPVKGGTFTMGSTPEEGDDYDNEKPAHKVTLSSYYIGQTEVTQELWQAVMGNNPSYFKGDKRPVENVSWSDCQKFVQKLNKLTGEQFRLPTEAEWEYAARGGNKSQGYKYSGSNNIDEVAWYKKKWYNFFSESQHHDVATKRPNELGIYDMSGNVEEWCQERHGINYCAISLHVLRGGHWEDDARYCRVAYGGGANYPDLAMDIAGLRLAR